MSTGVPSARRRTSRPPGLVVRGGRRLEHAVSPLAERAPLGARELEVFPRMAEGLLGSSPIAKGPVISEFTVNRHVANILALAKWELPSRAAAARAARPGWV